MRVLTCSTYLTPSIGATEAPWEGRDYDSLKFIKTIKGDKLNGWATIPVGGKTYQLTESNRDDVFGWFALMVWPSIALDVRERPMQLVPVPSSKSTVTAPILNGPPVRLAIALATLSGGAAVVHDLLRWKKAMPSARKGGGPRDPAELYPNVAVTEKPRSGPYILVDDTITGGGHVKACAAALKRTGAKVVLAVCAGRTVRESQKDPFALRVDEYDDLKP